MAQVTLYPNGSGSPSVTYESWTANYPGAGTSLAAIQSAIQHGDPYDPTNDINQDGAVNVADLTAYQMIDTSGASYPQHDQGLVPVSGASIPAGSVINWVAVVTVSASKNTGSPTIQHQIAVGGVTYGAEVTVGNHTELLARPGGGSWTLTDIAGLWAGVLLRSQSDAGGKGHASCTQLSVIVDYTPPGTGVDQIILLA